MGFVSVCFNVYWLHLPLNFICGKDLCNRVHKQNISVCVLQELVKLTIEKHEQPSPTSPSKPALPVAKAERFGFVYLHVCKNYTRSRY